MVFKDLLDFKVSEIQLFYGGFVVQVSGLRLYVNLEKELSGKFKEEDSFFIFCGVL